MSYQQLPTTEVGRICEYCLGDMTMYNIKWNGKKFRCVLNDNRSVVLCSNTGAPVRFYYREIKRVELRRWFKVVLVLENREVILSGYRRKSIFNAMKKYFMRQLQV